MANWSTSNYRQKKAQRLAQLPPQWVTNPDTQQEFLIRRVGALAYSIAGYAPNALKAEAVAAWKERGIEPGQSESQIQVADERLIEESKRNQRMIGRVVYEACVVPVLFTDGEDPEDILNRAMAACETAWGDSEDWKSADGNARIERASEIILNLEELDQSDILFIFRVATSAADGDRVPLKGGQAMQVADLKSFRKKPGRRARTGTGG
jgi:hypothetical protein